MTHSGEHPVRAALIGAVLACLLLAAPAEARYAPAAGILSPRLAKLARPALAGQGPARQAAALGLPGEGPGSLRRDGGRVLVEVRFQGGVLGRLGELRSAGARLLGASRRYQTATVALAPDRLAELDQVPGAVAASPVLAPRHAAACPSGPVVSEGDAQMGAPAARADFGVDGSGVTVGVISDSFATASGAATGAQADVASGDLPGSANPCGYTSPVDVLSDFAGAGEDESTDEGRAMAQVVHDVAPGAAIDFASAEGGETSFAAAIRRLAEAGADVIVDDISYFGEPDFQDGPIALAADEAVEKGVTYLSAAGNDSLEDAQGRQIASWETPKFRDAGKCPPKLEAVGAKPDDCLDFDPKEGPGHVDDTFGITVEAEETLILEVQWAEPVFGVEADLDAYLLDSKGEPIAGASSAGDNIEGEPVELIGWENTESIHEEVDLAIDRCFSTKEELEKDPKGGCNYQANPGRMPRVKVILPENGRGVSATEYPESAEGDVVGPTIGGHAGAPAVIAVGAVRATGTPFTHGGEVEPYSSHGPVTHYFGPVAASGAPAAPFPSPQVISKPDLSAPDCVSTSFFVPLTGLPGFHFCGTSAAGPHAAAVAALSRQADPAASAAQVRQGLESTARPAGAHAHDQFVGAGLVDAYAAIDRIALPPAIRFVEAPALTRLRRPSIGFAANRPVTFTCSLDGGPAVSCASPFVPERPLADGGHSLRVHGLDLGGRTGSADTSFTVDTVPPRTFFATHPRRNVRSRRARVLLRFRFGSDSPGSRFVCRVDKGLFHFCPGVLRRRFGAGRHTVRVKAVDRAGNVDPTAAVYRFRVRRVGRRR